MLNSFGNELRFLENKISTASEKEFNLRGKKVIRSIIGITGLPHFGARLRAFYLNKLLKSLDKSSNVLDAGCGIGLNTFLVSRHGLNVIGVDNDSKKIESAKKMLAKAKYKNTNFYVKDITKLDFKNEAFDIVVCFEVLEHIESDKEALSEICRVLKSGGNLLFSTPGEGFISKNSQHEKHHIREGYAIEKFTKMLRENNMSVEKVIKDEHTILGLTIRLLNDEVLKISLVLSTILFPMFLLLALVDGLLPETVTPNNWIMVAVKK